jgi:O-antigen/teichoic acid export membrane protein
MRSGVFRAGAIYTAANVLAAGVPFVLLPLLTRALDPAAYGVVVSFTMLVAICSATAGLGLHSAVGVRWLDRHGTDPRRYTGSAIVLTFVSTALTAAAAALIAPRWMVGLTAGMSAMAALVAGTTVLQAMRFAVWQSLERPLPAACLQVASALCNIALSLLAVLVYQQGAFGRILGATLTGTAAAAVSIGLLLAQRQAAAPAAADAKALLRFGVPLIPHTLAGALLVNADRLAVGSTLDIAALGVYGAAAQLGAVITVLADAAMKAYTPTMYRLLGAGTATARLKLVALTLASVLLWGVAALLLWAVFALFGGALLGERFASALQLSAWFLLGGAVSAIYLHFAGLFFFTGRTEWISLATVSATVLALLMAPVAVATFGVHGGGGSYLLAQVALALAAWALSRRFVPLPWHRPGLALRTLVRTTRRRAA